METKNISEFLNKKNTFAVIGASNNPKKYGNKIFLDLINSGYKTYPVNPNHSQIQNHKCYPSLEELPEKPDVISLVVPPKVSEKIVQKAFQLGIKKIWMQPGSESIKAIKFCKENKIKILHNSCILIENTNKKKQK